ncbi:MAG: hypothetical protein R3F05_14945 [Planctomycetota bacterium]
MKPPPGPDLLSRFHAAVPQRFLRWWRGDLQGKASVIRSYREQLLASPDEARARQREALRAFLVRAQAETRLHAERMKAAGVDPKADDPYEVLKALPSLDRETLVARLDDAVSTAHDRSTFHTVRTGGTTGEPAPFFLTREDAAAKNDLAEAMRNLMGWWPGQRAAYVWSAERDMPGHHGSWLHRTKAALVGRLLERRLYLPGTGLDDARMDSHLDALRRFRPAWVQAYAGPMDVLARHALARGRACPIPHVTMTAEPSTPDQRRRIAEAFGADVTMWYGSRETAWIAAECSQEKRLHVNHVQHVLEVDADGRMLVTDLLSGAMPLVRYAIGDCAVLGDTPCPCGDPRPVIQSLEGRLQDVLLLPSGMRIPGVILTRRGLSQVAPGIFETQYIQDAPDRLDVYYVPAPHFRPEHATALLADIKGLTRGELEIVGHEVTALRREPNGKIRYAICNVQHADVLGGDR